MVTSETLDAETQARETVKRARSSFYWAMRLLPLDKRNAMYAIYAFCRIVDDIVDNPGAAKDKRARLVAWRTEIANTFEGKPSGPIGKALVQALSRFGFRQNDFLAIIDGMEMDVGEGDVDSPVRIADLPELMLYCDRVAGAVGRLSNQVFGLKTEHGDRLATALGRALQLTNILRDLQEDAGQNRLYLPLDMLKQHGMDETEPSRVLTSPALPVVCNEIAAMAQEYFSEAEVILSGLERRQIRPVIIMKDIYKPVLHRLIRRGWTDLGKPVRLSKLARLWIVFRSGILGL